MHIARSVTFFLGGGKKNVSEGKMRISHATWSMCLKKYLWPLQQEGLRLQSDLIPWTQCSLDGKPSRTSPSAYGSGAAPSPDSLFPLSQSCTSAWAGQGVGHAAVGAVNCSSLAFVLSWCLSLELKLLFDSKRVAGLSDCPIYLEDPDVLQAAACYSELTHWDSCDSSCTTGSTLNLKLSLLKRSKVWIRQVLKVIQQQPKRPKFFSLCSYQKMAIKL